MEGRDFRSLLLAAAVIVASLVALATPGAAIGDDDPPVVDQYVEALPTAGGRQAQKKRSHRAKLPAAQEARLRRVTKADAVVLEKIATSSTYAAPSPERPSSTRPRSMPPQRSLAGATVGAASETGGTRVLVLALFLVLGTCLLVAARIIRARRSRG